MRLRFVAISALSALVGLAAGATAATWAPQHGPWPTFVGEHARGFGQDIDDRHVRAMLAFAEAELEITEAQLPQWRSLTEAIEAAATRVLAIGIFTYEDEQPAMTAVERLDLLQSLADVATTALDQIDPPFRALYGVLSDAQKEKLDDLLNMPHRRHS